MTATPRPPGARSIASAAAALVVTAGGLAADGWGFEGPAQTYGSACHRQPGASQPEHDFVFVVP